MRHVLLAIGLVYVLFAPAIGAAESTDYPRPHLLTQPQELAKLSGDSDLVILDVRSAEAFAAGHVPGAQQVDHSVWKQAFGDGQDARRWSQMIGDLGITRETPVVVYDDNSSKNAARVWWILKYWGVEDARLLNGGWTGWKSGDHPISTDAATDIKARGFQATPQRQRFAGKADVLGMLQDTDVQIVDSRSEAEYCGTDSLSNRRAGAIPGAKHLEWDDLIESETQRFKSADELSRLFREADIDPAKPATTHCQSGGRASVMAFALELMGGDQVRNYYRGWSEWGNQSDTPIETPQR